MATHAHSTRTPLLPLPGAVPPLLPAGSDRQAGPVSEAIRIMRAAHPDTAADAAIEAIRHGLDRYFSEADHQRVRELRRCFADRIEADLAALDALGGDSDLEDGGDAEPSLCGAGTHDGGVLNGMACHSGGDDREADAGDEPEDENEHGGDIQDEPHDAEEDGNRDSEDEPDFRSGVRRNPAIDRRSNELAAETRIGLDKIRRRKARAPAGDLRILALPIGWRA